MQETVSFDSHGLKLSGVVRIPDNAKGKVPAFLLLHGFGSNKEAHWMYLTAELLAKWGYASIRFDMRGCGESEGARGRVICLEQVEDTSSALTYMASRAEIDPARIGVLGHSFGAAVAVYAAGVDSRLAACISSGGWGDGPKKFRKQHASPEAWKKFTDMMEEGKKRKARGEQMMVPRWDIVPIPEHLRGNLSKGSFFEFPFDVVESMYNFMANDVVSKIAPRPLLLLHPSNDSVTPTEQSVDLFMHAGKDSTDLHLVAKTDHFILSEGNDIVLDLVKNWLEKNIPVDPSKVKASNSAHAKE
jgi:dipeptidyl aminopeptidase/acylaminoacyl peptidase